MPTPPPGGAPAASCRRYAEDPRLLRGTGADLGPLARKYPYQHRGSKAAMWSHHYLYLSSATVADSLGHTPADVLSTPLQMCHIAGLQVFAISALHAGCTAHLKSSFSASRCWDEIVADRATFAKASANSLRRRGQPVSSCAGIPDV